MPIRGVPLSSCPMTSPLHDTLPFLLNRVAARISDAANRQFKALGITVFSARVLILLHLGEASTVGELAEKAALDQSTLSHILRRLERDGLLNRNRLAHDNRTKMVCLTDKGNTTGAKCWAAVQAHDRVMREVLQPKELVVLKEILGALYQTISYFDKQIAGDCLDSAPPPQPQSPPPR
jgi:DNA-binding MarR family transcriptional regulator